MKPLIITFLTGCTVFLLCGCSSESSGKKGGLEEPSYRVLVKEGDFEIREYEPMIVAETMVQSDFKEAGNVAFRRLFDYISGSNRSQAKIAMTSPVEQQAQSQKIAMTAPVTQEKQGGNYAVRFVMPSEYTMQTLPVPNDEKVVLREVAARKMAAVRYSGMWSEKNYEKHKARLNAFLEEQQLQPIGEAVWARYNPPFTPFFLRRNEILIPVE